MLLFSFTPDFSVQPTEADKAVMKQAWGSFIGNIAISEKLVSTHQLGFEGNVLQADLSVSDQFMHPGQRTTGGNMVVKANSLAEATEMAKKCPILTMGGQVEIRSILPMEA